MDEQICTVPIALGKMLVMIAARNKEQTAEL
jgi:hypothetical protein